MVFGRTARTTAPTLLPVHRRMISEMEKAGQLDRALEGLPSDEALAGRLASGIGLTSPELAVLLAYAKINATKAVQSSTLPDDDWTRQVLEDYFPALLRESFADRMAGHRLRRELRPPREPRRRRQPRHRSRRRCSGCRPR